MGKGDQRSARGKRIIGSSGVTRQRKKVKYTPPAAAEAAPKKSPAKKAAPKKTTAKKTTAKKTTTKKAAAKKE